MAWGRRWASASHVVLHSPGIKASDARERRVEEE